MKHGLSSVTPTDSERREARVGDEIVASPDVVMDRAFTLDASPAAVWSWLEQLGKQRAGWYFPSWVERFIPPPRRGARVIDARFLGLIEGSVIPDYGGRDETFEVALIDRPHHLVYRSQRRHMRLTWSIELRPVNAGHKTRVLLRLRLGQVKHVGLAKSVGELIDLLTVAGLAAGLSERLSQTRP